jgi:hypothetical protein
MPDCPASYQRLRHRLMATEIHKWKDHGPCLKKTDLVAGNHANNPDVLWLWENTTRKYSE